MKHLHLLLFIFISYTTISQNTVVDVVEASEDHSIFEEMLQITEMDEWLEEQPYVTLFASENDAINATYSPAELDSLMQNEDEVLLDFVHNHIVLDTFVLEFGNSRTNFYGKRIYFFIDGAGNVIVGFNSSSPYPYLGNNNEIIQADNGGVYSVRNQALSIGNQSPVSLMSSNYVLQNLFFSAGYYQPLVDTSALYTLLIPPLDSTLLQIENLDLNDEAVRDSFVRTHIFSGHYRIQDLYNGLILKTWADTELLFQNTADIFHVNGADIISQCPTLKGNLFFLGNIIPETNGEDLEFAPIGAKWYFPEVYFNSPNQGLVSYTSVAEEVIFNRSVKTLLKDNGTCNGEADEYYVTDKSDSTFLYNPNNDRLELQWINKANVGDSWEIYKTFSSVPDTLICTVDSISTYTFPNGEFSRVQHVTLESRYGDIRQTVIYDRMGFFTSLFPVEMVSVCDGDFELDLRCYEDDEVGLINFSDVGCLYTPVDNIENELSIKLYPNPASSKVNIEAELPISEIKIYNPNGNLILAQDGNKKYFRCDTFQSGLYFVYLTTESAIEVHKIFIQ